MHRLPSIKSLVAFEVVLRHRSFSRAAQVLGVTQSAVSRQIAKLETHVGTALFVRDTVGVDLTEAGERYSREISRVVAALNQLGGANQTWLGRDSVTLACTQGVGELWVLPRLPALRAAFPDLEIELRIYESFTLLRSDEYDLAISFHDTPPDLDTLGQLGHEDTVPVMAPSLPPLSEQEAPLLLTMERALSGWTDWSNWLGMTGLELPEPTMRWKLGNYCLCIDAAARGLGVAMGWVWLLQDDLASGRLVLADPRHFRAGGRYYLTLSEYRNQRQITRRVGQWLLDSDGATAVTA
ncbi:LysR family transcriptional regulator [Palleronia sediminis]|uniref:LysR family transcriptional regulator n=1 Tax=Palleronia sediminis TaxID=2547833 RepID=A0A4R6AIA8_9RHOB|nr:LysR family transcriptional regulator [Palleronia sediminis]